MKPSARMRRNMLWRNAWRWTQSQNLLLCSKTLLWWLVSMSFLIWLTGDKGKFHHLVSSYRKRKLHEMESDVNKEEYKELKDKSLKDAETIKELKEKLNEFQDLALDNAENIGKLARLFDLGVIDKDGEYIYPQEE